MQYIDTDRPKPPKVIGYTRFSSKRQARGHSEVRQMDRAEEWCAERGYILDESLHFKDLGVSGFTGRNKTKGALSALLKAIELKQVPKGSILLIEHFDRLSREQVSDAEDLVRKVLRAGVEIHTLIDGRSYTEESLNNLGSLITMLTMFANSHDESKRKGERVAATFETFRNSRLKKFGSAPGWVRRTADGQDWEVVPELALSVKRVFELAANGVGGPSIARIANLEGWPIPTRKTALTEAKVHWHSKMPSILLRNEGVLGRHEYRRMDFKTRKEVNHEKGEGSKIIIEDYYPRIIEDDLWHRAKASIATRKKAPPRRDEHYLNIWAGVMKCGHCGASIQRKSERRGKSMAQLVCSNKLAGVTECKTGAAGLVDGVLLRTICSVAGQMLGLGYDKDEVISDIDIATSKLQDVGLRETNLMSMIELEGPTDAIRARMRELKRDRESLTLLIEERRQQLSMDPSSMLDTSYADGVIDVLYERSIEAKLARADCNARIRRAVECIWLFAYDLVVVQFKGEKTLLSVPMAVKNPRKDISVAFPASQRGELVLPGLKIGG